ncbi:MAG: hypothetical protein ACK5MQ_08080 [Pikeienuella sp.]
MAAQSITPIHDYRAILRRAEEIGRSSADLAEALRRLIAEEEEHLRLANRPEPPIPATLHNHRPGARRRLDRDPEQAAFIEARLPHMTYAEIADAARERFGEARAVGKSTVHNWHRKYRPSSRLPCPDAPDDPG